MSLVLPISKYEKVCILGVRATHLSNGAKPMTNIGNMTDPLKIAEKEYNEGVIPISIIRTLPGNKKVKIDILSEK